MEGATFISYAREDRDAARRIYAALRTAGIAVWFDQESLLPGQRWAFQITKAIRSASFVIILLSARSVTKRGVVQREIREALQVMQDLPEGRIFVIPARLEPVEPEHLLLRELHWVDLFDDWDTGVRRILLVVAGLPQGPPSPVPPIELVEFVKGVIGWRQPAHPRAVFQFTPQHERVMAIGSAVELQFALGHLLANAALHGVANALGIVEVAITIRPSEAKAVIVVENDIPVHVRVDLDPLSYVGLHRISQIVAQQKGTLTVARTQTRFSAQIALQRCP